MPDRGDGACIYLGPDNLCTIYETRPDVCNMEKMYEKRLKDNPESMEKLGKKGYFAFNNLVCNAMMEEDKMPEEYRIPVCLDDIQLNEAGGFIDTLIGKKEEVEDFEDLEVELYLYCKDCAKEKPKNKSHEDYSRISVGKTNRGLLIWCIRHAKLIAHINHEWDDLKPTCDCCGGDKHGK
jgi:hypothetical protein